MARSYYSTIFFSLLTRSGTSSASSTTILSGSMAREKVKSRPASRAKPSAPYAAFCTKARGYARSCLRCPTWNVRRPTNLLMRRRCRCKITGQPCEFCPSLMVIEPSWSGGQRSIVSPSAARSVLRSFVIRSGDGLARCGESWMDKVRIARSPSPSRAV